MRSSGDHVELPTSILKTDDTASDFFYFLFFTSSGRRAAVSLYTLGAASGGRCRTTATYTHQEQQVASTTIYQISEDGSYEAWRTTNRSTGASSKTPQQEGEDMERKTIWMLGCTPRLMRAGNITRLPNSGKPSEGGVTFFDRGTH
jgi:hypothetical protein